jgi:acyl carrier protein
MTEAELDSLISEVMSSVMQVDLPAGVNLSRSGEERWNSLKHIEMILSLESALNIRFSEDEIADISCIEDIKKRIRAKHAA